MRNMKWASSLLHTSSNVHPSSIRPQPLTSQPTIVALHFPWTLSNNGSPTVTASQLNTVKLFITRRPFSKSFLSKAAVNITDNQTYWETACS